MDVTVDDAGRLATVSRDGRIMVYDIRQLGRDVADPVAEACALAGGGLSRQAWSEVIPAEIPWVRTCA
jgi:hypothetical protein